MKEMYNFNVISKKRNIILGIATLLVAYCHSTSLLVENLFPIQIINNILVFIREIGTIGVDIFLILSGVGLYYSFSKNKNLKQFYKNFPYCNFFLNSYFNYSFPIIFRVISFKIVYDIYYIIIIEITIFACKI